MPSYKELVAQREALEQQIASAREAEVSQAVKQVKALVFEFSLTPDDVFGGKAQRAASGNKGKPVAAKYRNPETGATWTGRGKAPKWIADLDRSKFAI